MLNLKTNINLNIIPANDFVHWSYVVPYEESSAFIYDTS